MRRHRILYVHHRPELGGAPVSLSGLIGALDRDRFEPWVYCPPGPAAELFASAGATVVTGPVASFTHVWASYYSGLRWLLLARELRLLPANLVHFRRLLKRERFDIVHLNDSPLVYSAIASKLAGIPTIWHLRSSFARGGHDKRSRMLGWLIDHTAAAVIAIDEDVARSFRSPTTCEIVHNSVDLDYFTPQPSHEAKRRLGLRDDAVTVGLFGYLYAKKGWPDYLRAAKRLADRGLAVEFLIVGGGVRSPAFFNSLQGRLLTRAGLTSDEERRARVLAERLGIADHVHFLPFSSDPRDVYQALDIVTFPNRGEGLGRAVIEAAACGRPVVASGSSTGAGLIAVGETGDLLPRHSPDALSAALERLVVDGGLRAQLGAAARAHAETHFDARTNARRVMAVYERILEGAS